MNNNVLPESREELISMFIGLGVVIMVVVVLFNFVMRAKGSISVPGLSVQTTKSELTKPGEVENISSDVYEVKRGDSLWNIAVAKYGNGFMWTKIATENNITKPSTIEIGQKLVVPTMTQVEKLTVEGKGEIVEETYQVKIGDSLWSIAAVNLNDGHKWTQIWNLNKSKIVDPNRLEIGMVLKLR
ncbi:MAG: LysM peptidoglycan-binding domain-containing protein [Candidatus Shapirobacteria bacterium]